MSTKRVKSSPVERAATPVPPGCDPDSVVLAFDVPNELDGQRLDRFVHWRIPRLSRERAREIVDACAFHPDGARRISAERVRAGERVLLVRQRFIEPDAPREFAILHRDPWLTVVDKPAGLPVHPSATYHKNTLTKILLARFGREAPQICHRLDRETSGVLVCATPGPAEVKVKREFAERGVDKEYLAITRGPFPEETGVIELPLRRVQHGFHVLMEVHADGLAARTHYRVKARKGAHCLVELVPETGRQHQLRVHLAALGASILGDKLYGPEGDAPFAEFVRTGMTEALAARTGHERQALHAHRCALTHPERGTRIEFVAPLPSDLVKLWDSLGP